MTSSFPLEPRTLGAERYEAAAARLDTFLAYAADLGLELYAAQEEALLEITEDHNVILNTPTGSGKSLVATYACFSALGRGGRAYYTAPIKALVGEKFLAMCRTFGPDNVGMMTGDASVNPGAPIICCTAEILSNLALREGSHADIDWVIQDEFHYYSERERGMAWQVPLLTLSRARFLLMSATLGDTDFFEAELKRLTGAPSVTVRSSERPVPLDFRYVETPLHETLNELLASDRAPVYIVHFAQQAASEQAQRLTSLDFLTKEQKLELRKELSGFRFDTPFGRELSRFLPHGIGVHHAGLLPKYRLLVEKLAQKGLLKLICGTDTLGVGVNIPLRTVLFTQLCKYDGDKTKLLSVRDFHQIAGRAGRRGFDSRGSVVVQAPEHVIENLSMTRKAAGDPKKLRKIHPKKPPERGYAPWNEKTLEQLVQGKPEPLVSRFTVNHGMLLSVLARRNDDGCRAMRRLIHDCHESPAQKKRLGRTAFSLFRALYEGHIVEPTAGGVRVNDDLQEDFSLHHALSLYAVQAIDSLDQGEVGYPLRVLSIIESILENPAILLRRQIDKLKGIRMAELKHEGVEYEERLAELEKVTHKKPDEEFLLATFEHFRRQHPWVMGSALEPKSIVRDFYELGLGFNGYVKEYGLERSEGVLLRYLSETFRALERTVPELAKTEELWDVIDWLGAELRGADASLLEEWQRLAEPERVLAEERSPAVEDTHDITRDRRSFVAAIRNAAFGLVHAISRRDFVALNEQLQRWSNDTTWSALELERRFAAYFEEYPTLRTDPAARAPRYSVIEEGGDNWQVRQILLDPEEDLAWSLELEVDMAACRREGRPVMSLREISSS